VTFAPSAGRPCEALSLLRVKEKVQAALAKVAAEKELADRAAREAAVASQVLSGPAGAAEPSGGPLDVVSDPTASSPGLGGDLGPSRAKPR
jgi:hypothetical protein